MLSYKVPYNSEKEWKYIVGYQVARKTMIPLIAKTPENVSSYGVSQYVKNFTYTMSFNVSEALEWVLQYRNIWNDVESQLFEKLIAEPINREGKYMHGKLKTYKEGIKTNFYGQDAPFDMYCNGTVVLKIDSVYKQSKNYHPQVYVEECKCNDVGSRQRNVLSDSDDDGSFEV